MLDSDVFFHVFYDALFVFQIAIFHVSIIKIINAKLGALNDSACWEETQFYFCSCLVINILSNIWLDVVLCFN